MHSRVGLLNVLGAVVLAAATGWIVGGCAPGEAANKTLVAGLLLENTASIDIEKSTNGLDADDAPGPVIAVGSPVVWLYVVTNNGNADLANVAVSDDQGVTVSCPKTELASGESMTCSATGTAVEGQYTNVGTVTATDPLENVVTDSDASHYFGGAAASEAAIDIEKATNGEDADDAPGPTLNVGDPVEWSYVVTNTGVPALVDVAVTDSEGVVVTCPQTTLEPGESMTCTASGTAIEGQYENVGIVTGTDPAGEIVTDVDWSHYLGAAAVPEGPAIEIEKATNGEDADEPTGPVIPVGDPVAWTYVVTNTGTVALIDVAVADSDPAVVVTCPQTTLAVGESMTCTAEGVAVEGQYSNTGTVTATDESANPVTASDPSYYLGEAVVAEHHGCGLGFWKNHPEAWAATGHTADETVASVFASAAGYPGVADVTLAAALRLPGGPTLDDAAALLLKQAIPALLDAAHPDVGSALTEAEIIDLVNAALDSKDRSTILSAKADLSHNEDDCPFGEMDDDGENGHMNGHMNGHHDDGAEDDGADEGDGD